MPERATRRPTAWALLGVLAAGLVTPLSPVGPASAIPLGTSIGTIWTDFGGVWNSATNLAIPDTDHNLLAFEAGATVYSTGVNDAALSGAGVTFTPATFQALPVEGLPPTGTGNYYVARGNAEPTKPGFSSGASSATLASFLTSGINGLNLGSGITNVPSGATLTFNLVGGLSLGAIGDGVPDLLITQIANPAATTDTLEFRNASNNRVGIPVAIDQNASPSITRPVGVAQTLRVPPDPASFDAIYYVTSDAVSPSGFTFPVKSAVRMRSYELSEFGISGANASQIAKLVWLPGGFSDPAFFAYNTSSLSVVGGGRRLSGHRQQI